MLPWTLLALAAGAPLAELDLGSGDRVERTIRVAIGDDLTALEVQVEERFVPAAPIQGLQIALPAERYRSIPALRPSEIREIFPSGFSRGGFEGVEVAIDGNACRPERVELADGEAALWCPIEAAAGRPIQVATSARLVVPERYGPFGRVGRQLTLAAGWFPFAMRPGAGPARGRHLLQVRAPGDLSLVVRSRFFPAPGAARWIDAEEPDAAQIPLVLRPAYSRVLALEGGRVRHLTAPASAIQRQERSLAQRQIALAVSEGLAFWDRQGLPLPTADRPLILIDAPLRHDLARAADGLILVRDRAFQMWDVDRFLRFHRFPILREAFGAMLLPRLPGSTVARVVAADAAAACLLDRYVADRFGRAEDAFDVLGIVAFIPSIDSMLYAPDLPFVSAYFRVIREDDPLRAPLWAPGTDLPRGKLIYEKLIDRLGAPAAQAAVDAVVAGTPIAAAIREAFRSASGTAREAERFLASWLGRYPDVRYRLAGWSSRPAPQRCAGCWLAEVTIERQGEAAEEPITVLLIDDEGGRREVVERATVEPLRTVTATLGAELAVAQIDPHGRLAEAPTPDAPSPRYDNRSSPVWKVLLNNFNILVSATEGAIDTAIDVGFQRRYDVHWSFAARGDYAQEAIALSARATRSFGPPVTAARLAHFVGLGIAGEYLRPGFAGSDRSGLAGAVSLSYGFDTRASLWAPETGTALRLSVGYQRLISGDLEEGEGGGDSFAMSARFLQQVRLGARHQLALRASFSSYLLGEPRRQLLYALGGRGGARGYALDAELGRARILGSAEWLHPLLPRLDLNGFFLAWVTGLDGALYGDVAWIGDDPRAAFEGPVFGDVGYGLRLYIDYLGVRPGVMAIDIAWPLVPPRGTRDRGPPAVYIAFSQSFLAF
jgi:hypothetical protein